MEYRGLTLDPFQEEAVEYIEDDRSVLVAAPTGTGKTLIADYLIEQIIEDGGEVVYTAPVKALSNQKYREYVEQHGRENVGLVTGDLVINREAPLRIMTTEILRNVLLEGGMAPVHEGEDVDPDDLGVPAGEVDDGEVATPTDVEIPQLDELRAVIIDEIHFLDDRDRGTVWEELLIYLPARVRILGLSATLSNLREFADWLSEIRGTDVKVVREDERAVPLEFKMASVSTGIVDVDEYDRAYGEWKSHGGDAPMTKHVDIHEMLPADNYPALFFIFSRSMVERLAHGLTQTRVADKFHEMADQEAIRERLEEFDREHPDVLTGSLRSMYLKGIAGHHAGLHVALKALVERLYEDKLLNIVYCTSTFALGINMPARTVIFDSLQKYNGREFAPLTIREFMQMGGRAGRRGIDPVGEIVIRQDFDDYDEVRGLLEKLLSGESEPVTSSFNLSFHSVVNLLDNHDEERIKLLLDRSFKAYQRSESADRVREQLEEAEAELEAERDDADSTPSPSDLVDLRRKRREVSRLRRQLAEEERPRLWEEFQRKVSFLRNHGYIGDDNELLARAEVLRHIKFEEIFLTELVVRGLLEDREPAELFGIMCGLVHELPRKATVEKPADDKWWEIFSTINAVYESDVVQGAAELADEEAIFTPEMMPLGERWATGETLREILQLIHHRTDLSGGLVGAFRRGKDLVGQLRVVYGEDRRRRRELARLIRTVSRDEVQVLD